MRRKLQGILLILLSIFLVSCSSDDSASSNNPPLLVGMEANYPPYNWTQSTDANGAVPIQGTNEYANGYDVKIAKIIGEALDREVIAVKTEWEGLLPALQSDRIDVIIAGMSPTAERQEVIDFTDAYYDSQFALVVRSDSEYADAVSLEDFEGAVVTGQLGTLHYDLLEQIPGAEIEEAMRSFSAMRVALQSGRLDAYISEIPEAISATNAIPEFTYIIPDPAFEVEPEDRLVGIGVNKGQEAFVQELNAIIATITEEERNALMEEAINEQPSETDELDSAWNIFRNNWPAYLQGTINTLIISLTGTIIGLLIGLFVGVLRTIPQAKSTVRNWGLKLINLLLNVYITVFRGTPMIVQAMVVYYGTAMLWDWNLTPLSAAFLIVSINTGAYISEVVRGGIISIDAGQFEAARALGMNHWQTMKEIVMPQVFRNILPAVGNEFLINIKDTSVLNVISVNELYFASSAIAANSFRYFETFLITATIYLILTIVVTGILRLIEYRMDGKRSGTVLGANQVQVETVRGGD